MYCTVVVWNDEVPYHWRGTVHHIRGVLYLIFQHPNTPPWPLRSSLNQWGLLWIKSPFTCLLVFGNILICLYACLYCYVKKTYSLASLFAPLHLYGAWGLMHGACGNDTNFLAIVHANDKKKQQISNFLFFSNHCQFKLLKNKASLHHWYEARFYPNTVIRNLLKPGCWN